MAINPGNVNRGVRNPTVPGGGWQDKIRAAREAALKNRPGPGDINKPGNLNQSQNEKILQAQIKSAQTQIASIQKLIDGLKKPSSKDKKQTANYNARLATLKQQLAVQQSRYKTANDNLTKLYTSTGQYAKLLTGESRDAFLAIDTLFKGYGLESLAGKIYDYVKNGYSPDTISILLQDTNEYKTRFAGNEARKKAGLPVLSPGEYLSTEASYQQIMSAAGLPVGFYDQPSDFAGWIGKNVSPSEIQTRVDLATQATVLANPDYRRALNQMGISDKDMTAYFLDQKKSLPFIQKSAATAAVGANALAQGLRFDQAYSEQLALQGVSADEAKQGYSQIASELQSYKALGQIYGEEWNQRTSEQATFEGDAAALNKQRRLMSQERGAFGGNSGAARGGLSSGGGAR